MDASSSPVFGEEDAYYGSDGDGSVYLASQQDDVPTSPEYDGDEDGFDTRPRFQGTDKAFRDHIAKERRLLASLESQDSTDLSVHLYNAHALKQRLYRAPSSLGEDHFKTKSSWIEPKEDGAMPWHPPSDWVAWPLPPEHPSIQGNNEDRSDSAIFVDLLSAVRALILHRAKKHFDRREWIPDPLPSIISGRSVTLSTKARNEADEESENASTTTTKTSTPTFLVDEDDAIALTQPTAQHIVAKVDGLLDALHVNRLGHRLEKSHRSRDTSRSRSKTEVSADRSRKTVRRPSPEPGLRDWSDVLGVATLAGWDTTVVNRALQRCSSLLGEDMTFRTMHEPASTVIVGNAGEVGNRPEATQESIEDQDTDGETSEDEETATDDVPRDEQGHPFCPFPDCARSIVAYEKLWRWREHLKRTHKLGNDEVATLEVQYGRGKSVAPNRQESSLDDSADRFSCPYADCARHQEGFTVRWRLTEHLKRAHGNTLEDARRLMAGGNEQNHIAQDGPSNGKEKQGESASDHSQAENDSRQTSSRKRRLRD